MVLLLLNFYIKFWSHSISIRIIKGCVRSELPKEVEYLAVDGAYAKENFVSGAVALKLQVISKLRCDANLQFLYTGVQKQRGRPRKYAGKVDLADLSGFTFVETVQPDVALYTAVVFHVSLKRKGSSRLSGRPSPCHSCSHLLAV
jgi:hypothetical protein